MMARRISTSAVIATYNQDRYIREAVESLAHQVDEIIVVDDASTDETPLVLEAMTIPNLVVLSNHEQLGVSRSFGRAVERSTGDVLIIQGGDDRSLDGRVSAQVKALDDPTVSLVHSIPAVINGAGQQLPPELGAEFLIGVGVVDPLAFLFFEANFVCAPSAAVRRDDYLACGGFPTGLDLLQDYALWLQLAARGSFTSLPSPVVEYRKHGSNLSREYVGLGAPRRRRLAAELEFIRNDFLATSEAGTRSRLAAARNLDLAAFTALDDDEQIAVLQLTHGDKLILRRGLAFAFAAARSGEAQLARLGLALVDLSALAITADHENLDEVGRALGAIHDLSSLSTTE